MHYLQMLSMGAQTAVMSENVSGLLNVEFMENCGNRSMNNIIQLPVVTKLDLNADRVLENLIGKLDGFVLAGWDKEGNEFFSSTFADGGDVLWLVERLKLSLLNG